MDILHKYADLIMSMSLDFKVGKISADHYINTLRTSVSNMDRENAAKAPVVQDTCSHPDIGTDGGGDYCKTCGKRW
jgi:hypothetical protein